MSRRSKSKASQKAERRQLDPKRLATVRRRLGFVAVLWWISAVAGTLGLLQGREASWVRIVFISIAWLASAIFSFVWWSMRTDQTQR